MRSSSGKQLFVRDFGGYAGKLDKGKEWDALRARRCGPSSARSRRKVRAAYARGLDKGFFFVARTRGATEPTFADGRDRDGAGAHGRRCFTTIPTASAFAGCTDSDGRAFAISRAPRRQVAPGAGGAAAASRERRRQLRRSARGRDRSDDAGDGGAVHQQGALSTRWAWATNRSGQPMFTFVVTSGATAAYTIDTAKHGPRAARRATA